MLNFLDYVCSVEKLSREDVIQEMKMIHKVLLSKGKKDWQGRHYGDCTKQNITCVICVYQNWLDKYEEYTKSAIKQKYGLFDNEETPPINLGKNDIPVKLDKKDDGVWKKRKPKEEGDFICRMSNGYIKMCHWDGEVWLDMWNSNSAGQVKEWMNIPYDVI